MQPSDNAHRFPTLTRNPPRYYAYSLFIIQFISCNEWSIASQCHKNLVYNTTTVGVLIYSRSVVDMLLRAERSLLNYVSMLDVNLVQESIWTSDRIKYLRINQIPTLYNLLYSRYIIPNGDIIQGYGLIMPRGATIEHNYN